MKLYVSRYSNPELRSGKYTAVRISLGTPKWELGYRLAGDIPELMPFGLLNKYEDFEPFKREYFKRLERSTVYVIRKKLEGFAAKGKDVVLLCYEDIRTGPENWCHRTAFAEWWKMKTGIEVPELYDPTTPKVKAPPKSAKSPSKPGKTEENIEQLALF